MQVVQNFLKHQVESGKTPSIQYQVFNQDAILYEYLHGYGDIRMSRQVTQETSYHIYSITKTFTALAILQLTDQGKIDLNEPANTYLPEFPYKDVLTIKQLMNHTAGIPNPLPLNWIHLVQEEGGFNRDEFFKAVFAKHNILKNKSGSTFAYSNLGYVLLGQILETVSGMKYENYIERKIIEPLNLKPAEIGFGLKVETGAKGYQKRLSAINFLLGFFLDKKKYMDKSEGSWKPFRPFYVNGASYGGLLSSSKALLTYARALLNEDGSLLNKTSRQLMFTENKINGKPSGMCLSWFTGTLNGFRYYGHPGGGGGYYVELRIYPELGLGSTLMLNRSGMRDEKLLDKIDVHFLGK